MMFVVYFTVVALFGIGMYAILFKRNLIKIIIGVNLIECAINLFLVSLGYKEGGVAPIFTMAPHKNMVLPTPQALTLTSIVIGVAVTALMLSFAMNYYRAYSSLDASKGRLKR